MVRIDLITCPMWNAVRPRSPIHVVRASDRIIFHHTAGHHSEISGPASESRPEAMRYARDIQRFHMAPGGLGVPEGGIDSGHNFLVTRGGQILQGRWLTVSAIEAGHMVTSAHCPTQNGQIGIEHEHAGTERMTTVQIIASARLMAWISAEYRRAAILPVEPHSKYVNTSCPANLKSEIPEIRDRALFILKKETNLL